MWGQRKDDICDIVNIVVNSPIGDTVGCQQEKKRMLTFKMAIILPTGQWYAPSAVINDAWYCMVLHCIALNDTVLQGIA